MVAQGHKAITASGLATAIRSLQDHTPSEVSDG